ncbi:MAG: acyltransferase [Chitinophagaceae bacterium]|nr:acyltransferase [Chitinophagaceae bacterium]
MRLIKYFERKAKGKLVGELEGLRFLAIVPVVIQHYIERWHRNVDPSTLTEFQRIMIDYFLGGSSGVYLFYIISGFILTLPFAVRVTENKPKPLGNLKQYFVRRLTRLEPPYIAVMLIMAYAAYFFGKMETREILGYFFTGITYSTNLVYHHFNQLNPVIWSLEVEIQFYILAPFLAWAVFKIKSFQNRNIALVSAIVLAIVLQDITDITNGENFLRYTILGQVQYFLVGIMMVNLYLRKKLVPDGPDKQFWNVAATAAVFTMIGFYWVYGLIKTLVFTAVLTILFVGAFRSSWFNRFMKWPWIMAIGGMCYSIYLLHLAIAQASMEVMLRLKDNIKNDYLWFAGYTILFFGLLIVIVPIFYLLIEKPCMDHSWPYKLAAFFKSKMPWTTSVQKRDLPASKDI